MLTKSCRNFGDSIPDPGEHLQGEGHRPLQQQGEDGAVLRQGPQDVVPAAGVRGGSNSRILP